ncbi:hypothetical protein EW026_g989 [Hermanssonia centrifuga]|uniref:Uncharacterized protein n=1 Tax=Hermanssonia centrifuga TaxID=98765 RepID=A0A4S4KUM4_9APHY|nr:hypothetical protein EW026_g989 [Hermanssonia centrifuga]
MPDSPTTSPPTLPTGNPKRNSHHRRRSSVSTRRESAEIMGVSLPTIAASVVDDNINLGDKDSIRRRALWTLEGRTDVGAFSKVEIPELNTPEIERRHEFPSKPSYPPGIGAGYGGGLNTLGSKRDSFGKFMPSASSKEQLHTLMEEEEEEEEGENNVGRVSISAPTGESVTSPVELVVTVPSPAPVRHRPASLNLRPLSLASSGLINAADLPTPSPTPSPRPRPGLRSLTLAPTSSSDSSWGTSEPPSDELLQLITDLKAERDELKKDVDGWRSRVSDCEHQATLLMKRVETERREAWVARERLGLVEIEKGSMERTLCEKTAWGEEGWRNYEEAQFDLIKAEEECDRLRKELKVKVELQSECLTLAAALTEERRRREDAERELEGVLATPTPRAFETNFNVESLDGNDLSTDRHQFALKVVEEEEEDTQSECAADELSKYEEEGEDDDFAFQMSFSNSSFDSMDELPRGTSHLLDTSTDSDSTPGLSNSRSSTASPVLPSPPQTHARYRSLSKAWTFPQCTDSTVLNREPEEIDRFFGCLDDVDNSPPLDSNLRSAESCKNLFSRALADADDDFPPFVIPANVGTEMSQSESKASLDVVIEEEEEEEEGPGALASDDEFVGQEVEGGIIFTFTPPSFYESVESGDKPIPATSTTTFLCGEDGIPTIENAVSETAPVPASRLPQSKASASAIPTPLASTPVKSNLMRFPRAESSPHQFSTPPAKQQAAGSTFNSRESPYAMSPKGHPVSFIPQPKRSSPYQKSASAAMVPVKAPTALRSTF